jgi:MFS-type transporter involved in bile tolerance (Atg22 family)
MATAGEVCEPGTELQAKMAPSLCSCWMLIFTLPLHKQKK